MRGDEEEDRSEERYRLAFIKSSYFIGRDLIDWNMLSTISLSPSALNSYYRKRNSSRVSSPLNRLLVFH